MPGDPKQCYEHAKGCLTLAQETTNPALKDSLTDIAEQWRRLATSLETTNRLLAEWGDPRFRFTGCISGLDAESLSKTAEKDKSI